MRKRLLVALLLPAVLAASAPLGDSMYGTVREVRRSNRVTLVAADEVYQVGLVGVEPVRSAQMEEQARTLLRSLVQGRRVQLRFEYRTRDGVMLGRLLLADSAAGPRGVDVGVELMRRGLVRRAPNYDYKYRELSAAENLARRERLGIWSARR